MPEALIVACAQVGCEPIEMGLAPVAAIEKVVSLQFIKYGYLLGMRFFSLLVLIGPKAQWIYSR